MTYYIKGSDVLWIADDLCIHFDPESNTPVAEQYRAWLTEGNEPKEWSAE